MHNRSSTPLFFLVVSIAFFPFSAFASIIITEIMYDLPSPGADERREWVEVYNEGVVTIDLSLWKLFEDKVNHKLSLFEGPSIISPGSFAIIASDPATFKKEWPSFSGALLNSSFSLSNSGESISIKNPELIEVKSVTYSAHNGGSGDGNSLQYINGTWVASFPTPGSKNIPPSIPTPLLKDSVVVEPTKPLPIRSDSPPPTPTKKVSQSIPSVSTNVKEDNFTPNNTVPTSSSNVATVIATKNRGSDTLSFALFALVGLIAIPIVVLALPKRGERSDKITIIE